MRERQRKVFNSPFVMFSVQGAASAHEAVYTVGDLATQIETERVAANAQGKRLRFGAGYFYARRWNPQSEFQVEGSGIDVTYLVSGKDLPFLRTQVQSPASSALRTWMDDNSTQIDVTSIAMGLSKNPLSTDNTYVSEIFLGSNPIVLGLRAKQRAYIASNSIHPYTMAETKKSYLGEPFNILRVTENSVLVEGKLRWHGQYLLATQQAVTYSTLTGAFTVGQVLTSSGGATGTIVSVSASSATAGKIVVSGVTGTFTNTHTISDPLGGGATISATTRSFWGGDNCFINTIPEGKFYLGNFTMVGAPPQGEVMKVDVTVKGSGYTTPPTVVFDNTGTDGTGAAAVATLQVVGGSVTSAGTGYTNGASVTFSGGGASKQATGTLVVSGGAITGITITNPGDRYTSVPTIQLRVTVDFDTETANFTVGQVLTGGTSGATGTIVSVTDNGASGSIVLSGVTALFQNNETITDPLGGSALVDGSPSPAAYGGAITALMGLGEISLEYGGGTVDANYSHGSGYTSAPTISFTGGAGTGAAATCRIDGTVFDADYDVDTSEESYHAHALGCWYCPGIVLENIKGDDLWEGLLETRFSPFWKAKGIVVDRLCNYKTIPANWSGRLGYGKSGSGGMGVLYDLVCERSSRHPYTDDDATTSTSFATMKSTRWMELGGPVNNTIYSIISKGATGTTVGAHESCNGLEIFSLVDENNYQGDQDESYRGCALQLRGSNIHVHNITVKGGSDGIRYQDTEQPFSIHRIDNANISDLTDFTENSHAYRGNAVTTAFKSKVVFGNLNAHNCGKAMRLDYGSDTSVIGKVSSAFIRHSHIDIQDGAKFNIAESLADFTDVPVDLTTSSRIDWNFAGTTSGNSIGLHTCILGATLNPTYTVKGTATAHALALGKRRILNPLGVTVPTYFQDYTKFTLTPVDETQIRLGLLDTDYSHSLRVQAGSNLTADRILTLTTGDANRTLTIGGDATVNASTNIVNITLNLDGGGAVLTTGVKRYLPIPFAMTITDWTLVSAESGSLVIDVWKDTYANYPPTVADTIAGSEKPTLSSAQKNQDTSLSTWTTSVAAGDILGFNVDSATTITNATLTIRGVKV